VFVGTRVPFQTLLDYLEAGDPFRDLLALAQGQFDVFLTDIRRSLLPPSQLDRLEHGPGHPGYVEREEYCACPDECHLCARRRK